MYRCLENVTPLVNVKIFRLAVPRQSGEPVRDKTVKVSQISESTLTLVSQVRGADDSQHLVQLELIQLVNGR